MTISGKLHNRIVFQRRVRVLASLLMELIPPDSNILDLGCGDGLISSIIMNERPDISIVGIDILLRPHTHIPVHIFDGKNIPFKDTTFSGTIFTDVLHHTGDPQSLIAEAKRVSNNFIIIKDHITASWFDNITLEFMDWFGNASHGVNMPYNFLPEETWKDIARDLKMTISVFNKKIPLYRWPASLLFNRSLHILMKLNS